MKVLVIQPKIGMGDMIIYLPYIHAISKKYGVPVSLLVKNNSRASDLLSDDESINKIILLERNSRSKKGLHDGITELLSKIGKWVAEGNHLPSYVILPPSTNNCSTSKKEDEVL